MQTLPRITVTVGLPMYRCGKIAWLALEGLCRQQGVDFSWELIVSEEPEEAFTEERLRSYEPRLRAVGCVRIAYLRTAEWIPLSTKWCRIARQASPGSEIFVLQDGDDYSQPRRLATTVALFEDPGVDWVQSPLGCFFNIASGKVSVFDYALYSDYADPATGWVEVCRRRGWLDTSGLSHAWSQWRKRPAAIGKATRTRYLRQVVDQRVPRSVDGWLFCSVEKVKQALPVVAWDESDGWRSGVYTDGFNRLTTLRGWLTEEAEPPFRRSDLSIEQILPPDVAKMLHGVRFDAAMNLVALQQEGIRELKEAFLPKKAKLLDRIARRDLEIAKLRVELDAVPRPWWWYRRLARERLPRCLRRVIPRRKTSRSVHHVV